ncbi:MAG TPA: formylglycine-generating enzyme family protein, partial [Alphaproteobacteria bacterium]|nr:formylglycine-generating enzyme family protein [Alphaproteobacteria bacterium]
MNFKFLKFLTALLAVFLLAFGSSPIASTARDMLKALKETPQPIAMVVAPPKLPSRPSQAKPAAEMDFDPGSTFRDCEGCPEMVVIPAGSFRMGDLNGDGSSEEKPVRKVTILNKFAIGKFEVTINEFSTFVKATGYRTSGECHYYTGSEWKKSSSKNWRNPGFGQTNRDPVVCMNWEDAKAYVRWLSGKTGKGYRLLSEAEWEYAARSGTSTKYHFGNDISVSQANFNRNVKKTTPVGNYPSNGFGLHDMHGNVWEWTEDCYQDSYRGTPTDGKANEGP